MTSARILINIAYENIFCTYQLGVIYRDVVILFGHFKNKDILGHKTNEVFI